jgi:hypothetical protein
MYEHMINRASNEGVACIYKYAKCIGAHDIHVGLYDDMYAISFSSRLTRTAICDVLRLVIYDHPDDIGAFISVMTHLARTKDDDLPDQERHRRMDKAYYMQHPRGASSPEAILIAARNMN